MPFLVIVTFPAVHMSCQAMSPISHWEGNFLHGWAGAADHPANLQLLGVDANILQWIYIYFLSIFFSNCGFSWLLAPPVHLPFIMYFFWAWSQIFHRIILATPPLPTVSSSGWGHWEEDLLGNKAQASKRGLWLLEGTRAEQNSLLGGTARTKPSDYIYRQREKHMWFMFVACRTYTIFPFLYNPFRLICICIHAQMRIIRLRFTRFSLIFFF